MRILVIEDDKKIASFLVKGFKQSGFAADSAADGEEGLALALATPYDAAVIEQIDKALYKIRKDCE